MTKQYIGLRVPEEDRALLEKVCKARGENLSDFVRLAIRRQLALLNFYPDEVKKALGVPAKEGGLDA